MTKGRVSISRKNRDTGEYVQDFSGFITFVGTAAARKALSLKERDRIQLGDVDVSNRYVKEKNTTYTDFKVFSFKTQDELDGNTGAQQAPKTSGGAHGSIDDYVNNVGDGEIDDEGLPF
jgi:hypothetical protein